MIVTHPAIVDKHHVAHHTFLLDSNGLYTLGTWVYHNFDRVAESIQRGMDMAITDRPGYFKLDRYCRQRHGEEKGIIFRWRYETRTGLQKDKALNRIQINTLIGICYALKHLIEKEK